MLVDFVSAAINVADSVGFTYETLGIVVNGSVCWKSGRSNNSPSKFLDIDFLNQCVIPAEL